MVADGNRKEAVAWLLYVTFSPRYPVPSGVRFLRALALTLPIRAP